MNGVFFLDKPAGLSSHSAVGKVKRLLSTKKAGHTGTLDPFATGLLPICLGEATKFTHDLLDADKGYEATIHLGITTSTGDIEGAPCAVRPVDVSTEQIESVLAQFCGKITQIPPMFSALKHKGKPLYEYARQGITLERNARAITIHSLAYTHYTPPFLKIAVRCSKGTYIRVLAEDIGKALGCGAHLASLCRTQVGNFSLANAFSLEALEALDIKNRASYIQPVDILLSSYKKIQLSADLAKRLLHGQKLSLLKEGVVLEDALKNVYGRVRVYNEEGVFLGSALLDHYCILIPERLIIPILNEL